MRIRSVFAALALVAGTVLASSAPAHAGQVPATAGPVTPQSAFGVTPIGTFEYSYQGVTIRVPAGCVLSHAIFGTGTSVNRDHGGTDCEGPIAILKPFCNWRIDFKYYQESDGKLYKWNQGSLHSRCDLILDRNVQYSPPFHARLGQACTVMMISGKERARQCHHILSS